jgi:hypothetical protein
MQVGQMVGRNATSKKRENLGYLEIDNNILLKYLEALDKKYIIFLSSAFCGIFPSRRISEKQHYI